MHGLIVFDFRIAFLKCVDAFEEQQSGDLLSQHELMKVLRTKQSMRFVKADKKLVYSMLAMDKIIQRPQTSDHLMLQTCSELTASIRSYFMNVNEAADNDVLKAMYNNRNMMGDMDSRHSGLVDIAKAIILVYMTEDEKKQLLPSTSRQYDPNKWFHTLLTFKLKIDSEHLQRKLKTLRTFVSIMNGEEIKHGISMSRLTVIKTKMSQFMVRGGAKIRDVYVLFWYIMLLPDIDEGQDITKIKFVQYLENEWQSDKPFLLDRFKEKGK